MKLKTSFIFFLTLFMSVAFTIYQAGTASARPNGINGYSGNPATNGGAICSNCHFGGIAPTVSLSGPNTVDAGSTHTYTLTITGGQEIAGGLDVSVINGLLNAIDPGTQILSGEITHTEPRPAANNAVSWTFEWTAPAVAGTVTMYGAGNSINGNGGTSGDAPNKDSLTIIVNVPAPLNQPPVADAGGPYAGIAGDPVQFDGSGSSDVDGTIVSYDWDFGDGSTGTGVAPTYAYAVEGSYVVTLTVTDNGSLTHSNQTAADITAPAPVNQPPVADAGGPYSAAEGEPVQFNGSGSTDPNGNGTIVSYDWDFGDGSTGTGVAPTYAYAVEGSYVVTLTVTDNGSLTHSNQTSADIAAPAPVNQPPVADAGGPYTGMAVDPVQFDGSGSSDADGTIVSYDWDFGDGSTGTGVAPTYAYAVEGSYVVTLTVTDNGSLTHSNQTSADIAAPAPVNQPPVADAGGPYTGMAVDPVQFDGSGSSDADGTIVSYDWDFGDGSTGTGVAPTHIYAAEGSYVVTLTVTDDGSLTHSNQTSAQIFPGPTPTMIRLRTPGKVRVTARRTPTRTISVTTSLQGVPDGETLCGTAFLDRNEEAHMNQDICITAGSKSTVKFRHTFTADDSPEVEWTVYIVLDSVYESNHVTKTTVVVVR